MNDNNVQFFTTDIFLSLSDHGFDGFNHQIIFQVCFSFNNGDMMITDQQKKRNEIKK